MGESSNVERTDTPVLIQPDVRISVTDFGPIANGAVDLRPLTVFVGPSNTGKTYLAVLIYALHRVLGGFPRFPVPVFHDDKKPADDTVRAEEIQNIREKLKTGEQALGFSDLPAVMRNAARAYLKDSSWLNNHLKNQLLRCFDLEAVSDLNRSLGTPAGMKLALSVTEKARTLWHLDAGVSQAGVKIDGQIEDMTLLHERQRDAGLVYDPALFRLFSEALASNTEREPTRDALGASARTPPHSFPTYLFRKPELSSYPVGDSVASSAYYLPAARSGIMQSHRVITSSLVARSVRAGFERVELPTFSGVMADFMERLILYEGGRRKAPWNPLDALFSRERERWHDELSKQVKEIADALEREVLAGQIQTRKASPIAYPEFVYRELETTQDLRLTRASSMVSELAPVVLFLRGAVNKGDTLIIEEPEAHLHPAAQTRMAVALARLVRAGVRVVVTTHSDWLLQEIGNLIREGELEERTGEPASEGELPSSLRPNEVGIWLFRRDGDSAGSIVEEVPFDRSEGVEPEEYEDVAEELYNRSANLQNRLEETAGEPERNDA